MERYYFDKNLEKNWYQTIWAGFFQTKIDEPYIASNKENLDKMNDLLIEVCDQHFWININENYIYLSADMDERYYYYQFEKHVKKAFLEIEKQFNVNIEIGEFHGTEVKHMGSQFYYIVNRFEENDNKLTLRKKVLNWETYENLKKKKNKVT